MNDDTNVLEMKKFLGMTDQDIQAEMLAKHARTMCLMYRATKDKKYLKQAKLDVLRAKSIRSGGFPRPLGVLLAS